MSVMKRYFKHFTSTVHFIISCSSLLLTLQECVDFVTQPIQLKPVSSHGGGNKVIMYFIFNSLSNNFKYCTIFSSQKTPLSFLWHCLQIYGMHVEMQKPTWADIKVYTVQTFLKWMSGSKEKSNKLNKSIIKWFWFMLDGGCFISCNQNSM